MTTLAFHGIPALAAGRYPHMLFADGDSNAPAFIADQPANAT
jgi:hypothetical protein